MIITSYNEWIFDIEETHHVQIGKDIFLEELISFNYGKALAKWIFISNKLSYPDQGIRDQLNLLRVF